MQHTLDGVVGASVAPGVALVVDHPIHGTWAGASGVADLSTKEALSAGQRFRAGSMLKTAVATAVLQLVERGQRSLDDTLKNLLPADITTRIENAEAITLRMLLNHTSGIPEFATASFDLEVIAAPTRVWTLSELLDRAVAQPATFAPGAGWAYSNTNYVLLGEILTATTSQPWRQTLAERVFVPANLTNTTLPPAGDSTCNRCARGYEYLDSTFVDVTVVDPSMAGASGGSSLVTTPADLVKLVRALVAGKLFEKPDTLQTMLELTDAPIPEEAQTGYGLGLVRFQVGDVELFGHLGGTAGYQGFVLFQPSSGIVTSGYMNRRGDLGAFILPVLEAIGRLP